MPRASPSSQWGLGAKSKSGFSPQTFSSRLSCSSLPTGTLSCGEVGQGLHDLAQALVGGGCGLFEGVYLGLQSAGPLGLGGGVGAFAPQLCNLFGQLVSLGLQGFDLGNGIATFAVDGCEVTQCDGRVHAARAQFFLYQGQVRPDKCKINHYKHFSVLWRDGVKP